MHSTDASVYLSGSLPELERARFQVQSLQICEALSTHSQARLQLLSPNPDLDLPAFLGQALCIHIPAAGAVRHFQGVVTQVQRDSDCASSHTRYVLVLRSWTALLVHNRDYRIYQNLSVIQIVQAVFFRNGRTDRDFSLKGLSRSYPSLEYTVQCDETDADFFMRLLAREGIYFHIEHQPDHHVLVLNDHPGAHQAVPGCESLPYIPGAESLFVAERDWVSHLSWSQSLYTARQVLRSVSCRVPSFPEDLRATGELTACNRGFEHYAFHGAWAEERVDLHQVRLMLEREVSQSMRLEGKTVCRGLASGHLLGIENFNQAHAMSPFLLTSSTLSMELPAAWGAQSSALGVQCSFSAIPHSVCYRPALRGPEPVLAGVHLAVVQGPHQDDVYTDALGRVKVRFHWDRHAGDESDSSCWIRCMQVSAGKAWGASGLPRVGQEVLVAFEQGNPERPFVLGCVHNGEQLPAYPLPQSKVVSGFKTRSCPQGGESEFNEIRLDDLRGQESIHLQAQRDWSCLVKNDKHEEVRGNQVQRTAGHHTLSAVGELSVLSAERLVLGAGACSIVIENGAIHLNGPVLAASPSSPSLPVGEAD